MAYFADLTPYAYDMTPSDLVVLNIGWLSSSHPFNRGKTSREFQQALASLCQNPVFLHRGFHRCEFCASRTGWWPFKRQEPARGSGQIRVLDEQGHWYAAPTLTHHYVVTHGYQPPEIFVQTVLNPVRVWQEDR